jgi:hypothetical protein
MGFAVRSRVSREVLYRKREERKRLVVEEMKAQGGRAVGALTHHDATA